MPNSTSPSPGPDNALSQLVYVFKLLIGSVATFYTIVYAYFASTRTVVGAWALSILAFKILLLFEIAGQYPLSAVRIIWTGQPGSVSSRLYETGRIAIELENAEDVQENVPGMEGYKNVTKSYKEAVVDLGGWLTHIGLGDGLRVYNRLGLWVVEWRALWNERAVEDALHRVRTYREMVEAGLGRGILRELVVQQKRMHDAFAGELAALREGREGSRPATIFGRPGTPANTGAGAGGGGGGGGGLSSRPFSAHVLFDGFVNVSEEDLDAVSE